MIPKLSQGLADLAGRLMHDIAPQAANRYAMADLGMVGMLLGALALDAERAAAVRMTDIDEMKALFAAAGNDADPPRAAARRRFRSEAPESLRLSDIDALHGSGLALLIELHAWAEVENARLDGQIWEFLARHTERHRLEPPAGT